MNATIIKAKTQVYGVVPVPDRDTICVFYRHDGEWRGVSSILYDEGGSALIGFPKPEVVEALDRAYDQWVADHTYGR